MTRKTVWGIPKCFTTNPGGTHGDRQSFQSHFNQIDRHISKFERKERKNLTRRKYFINQRLHHDHSFDKIMEKAVQSRALFRRPRQSNATRITWCLLFALANSFQIFFFAPFCSLFRQRIIIVVRDLKITDWNISIGGLDTTNWLCTNLSLPLSPPRPSPAHSSRTHHARSLHFNRFLWNKIM